jgi:single-stranded-DNA-specific exonuclease
MRKSDSLRKEILQCYLQAWRRKRPRLKHILDNPSHNAHAASVAVGRLLSRPPEKQDGWLRQLSDQKDGNLDQLLERTSGAALLILDEAKKGSQILVLSHFDADGLSAASIIGSALHRLGSSMHIRAVDGLDEDTLNQAPLDTSDLTIFTDMGSGILDLLNLKIIRRAAVIDHHQPVGTSEEKILHVNPHMFGFDGATEISAAGMTYLVARAMNPQNVDLSALAVVGALGDMQDRGEKRSLHGLNSMIVEDGVKAGAVRLDKDLVLYGRETRPIHRALAYTSNPFLPGLSSQEDRCLALVTSAGIPVKQDDRWRTLADLRDEEKQNLLSAIIRAVTSRGAAGKIALNLIGTAYTLPKEERGVPTRDAREFSSLLNACGRMNRQGLAISICMGARGIVMDEGQEVLTEYRRRVAQYMTWVTETPERVEELNAISVIHGEGTIDENMTGTISTILVSSGMFNPMKAVFVLARTRDGDLKISARGTEKLVSSGVNLGKILQELTSKYKGSGGGHDIAAGANIPADSKTEFFRELDTRIAQSLKARN